MQADGGQRVLQVGAGAVVHVDVPGRYARDSEPLGDGGQPPISHPVASPEGTLELDSEAVAPEGLPQPPSEHERALDLSVLPAPRERPIARAPGQADEPLASLLQGLERQHGRQRLAVGMGACPRVRLRDQPTKVAIAVGVLDEQRDVECRSLGAPRRRHLRPRDRPHAGGFRGLRHLHRSPETVVVGQRDRPLPQLRRAQRELLGKRRSVAEGVGAVRVQLYV